MAKFFDKLRAFHPGDHVNMRAFLLMLSGFVFLAFLISLSIIFVNLRNRKLAEDKVREQSSFMSSLDSSLDILRTGDFVFPEQENLKQTGPHLQREPKDSWSDEEVERYWIDPAETGIGEIGDHNRELVEKMMEAIP
ncbi:MAG: hypothetical protein PQJ60_13735 [Spirochaetales bacterium]|nr:hypothetical protein [Spirochaetales bacterium]